ncbi:MAG: Uma2 family endonuclease [Candidatus Tectomicrobia bacterium]|nr:Uma2 family endonuclease [Candidatus Tectomicrobia bacterium]
MAIATESPTGVVALQWPLSDEQFIQLCRLNPEMRFEYTSSGDLLIMTSTGGWTGNRNIRIATRLQLWAETDGSGLAFDSSTLFLLPNGARRMPDASWLRLDRWNRLPREQQDGIPPLCPDFVLELRSPSDRLPDLQDKMAEYIANGARLGWLIDPIEQVVVVYRPDAAVERLEAPAELSGEPVLPGFVLALTAFWPSSSL